MRLFSRKPKGGADVRKKYLYSNKGAVGMKIVSDPPSEKAGLDVVFVHGLTGHREKTWTHQNNTFWPRDLLAKDFPQARIMTYGYDIDIDEFSAAAFLNDLNDLGQDMGYSLVSQRNECPSRPILFIAHGVGGLVCQQTLILSNNIDGLWQISSSCMGVIFMGTPHGGSALALYGEKLAKCMDIVPSANWEISGPCGLGSDYLHRIEDDFGAVLHTDSPPKIFYFYEVIVMNNEVGKIVEGQAAVLREYDNGRINANHFDMVKFGGNSDEGYFSVRSVIMGWLQEPHREPSANISPAGDNGGRSTPPWLWGLEMQVPITFEGPSMRNMS